MRDDYRAGSLLALLVNALSRKGSTKVKWFDFFPEHDPARGPRRRQTPAEVWKAIERGARAAGILAPAKKGKR